MNRALFRIIRTSELSELTKRTVYILSGPAGVGKSTTSRALVHALERSAYISGDDVSHLPVNGRGQPWICENTLKLTWINILSLAKNLIEFDYDVVIDYVAFPKEAAWLCRQLNEYDLTVKYVVFMVDLKTLLLRDQSRPVEVQMGERCAILLEEFEAALSDRRHVLETTGLTAGQLDHIIAAIKADERFVVCGS